MCEFIGDGRAVLTKAVAQLLSTTELPLATIARRRGFGSIETFRQAFLDHVDTALSVFRRTAQRHGAADCPCTATP